MVEGKPKGTGKGGANELSERKFRGAAQIGKTDNKGVNHS